MEDGIWFAPRHELCYDGLNEIVQCIEVAIMGTDGPRELPDPFNGIEFGTVWREKIQSEHVPMFC